MYDLNHERLVDRKEAIEYIRRMESCFWVAIKPCFPFDLDIELQKNYSKESLEMAKTATSERERQWYYDEHDRWYISRYERCF